MKKLVIEFSNERLITPGGLSLVGQLLGKSNFIKKCNNMKVDGKRSQSQIKNGDILLSYTGLLCQGNTPVFLKQTLQLGHQLTDKQLLVRMDAGNDAAENLGILIEDGSWFIVKRNLRRGESKEDWIAKVKECCKDIRKPRDGKTVYIGSSWKDVTYTDSEGESKTITMRIVYEVIERTTDKNGQFLLVPDIECNTI